MRGLWIYFFKEGQYFRMKSGHIRFIKFLSISLSKMERSMERIYFKHPSQSPLNRGDFSFSEKILLCSDPPLGIRP